MNILMNDINVMASEVDMNIREYTESTIDLIDKMENLELIRSTYFTEAKKEEADESTLAAKKSMFEKIKNSIKTIFDKLIHAIPNLFKRIKSSSQKSKVEKIGSKLNKLSKMGVELGKVKVSIPNIQTFDSFINMMISVYVQQFTYKNISLTKNMRYGPKETKIDALIDNINKMTTELSSESAKANNISEILAATYKKFPGVSSGYRAMGITNTIADQRRRNNSYSDRAVSAAIKNKKSSSLTNAPSTGRLKYESANDATESSGVYTELSEESLDRIMNNTKNIMGVGAAAVLGLQTIVFATIGITICTALKRYFSNAPSKISMETLTVSALYKRTMDIKLDTLENRMVKTINEGLAGILDGMTLEEFAESDSRNKSLVKSAQKLCELLNAYTKFQIAELNYYYGVLLELDSKLTVKNIKAANGKPIMTKESVDNDAEVNMEDFMDLESFAAIN